MKKFEKGKRFLTFLLVALMVIQQSSVTTLAEELAEYTQEAQNQDAEAVAEVSEASEPEASVPDSDKAQEQQPAAEEPAAPAEQETAEVTEAPQATEAPAQEAAPTEAPAQEAEQTEAPQENAAVTETPQATEAPAVTEAPAETATKAQFSGAVDNATANVTLSQPISDKAVFVAKQYSVDSDYFANNAEAAVSQWVANNGLTVLDATAYDMHFEEGGQEIAVNQSANVSLSFNSPILTMTGDAGVPSNAYVLHIVNGQAVAAGSASQDGNGAVVAANVVTEGFSPFVFVRAVSGDAVEPTVYLTDLSQFFTNMKVYVDGKEITGNEEVKPTSKFKFSIGFATDNEKQLAKTVTFKMPNNLVNWPAEGVLLEDDGETVAADYTIDAAGNVTVVFTDEFMDKAAKGDVIGHFSFEADIKRENNEKEITVKIPNTKCEKTITFDTNVGLSATKGAEFDPKTGEITYTVTTTAYGGTVTDVEIQDTLGSDLEFIKTNGSDYTLTIDGTSTSGDFTDGKATIGTLEDGKTAILVYKARFKNGLPSDLSKIELDKTNNKVKATGKNNNNDINSNEPEINVGDKLKHYEWIGKSSDGTQTTDDKTYVKWRVEYNKTNMSSVKGNTVTDTLPDDHTSKLVKGDVIEVTRSDGKKFTIPVTEDGYSWLYVIGDNAEDSYIDDAESFSYIFTYKSLVDADKLANTWETVKVNNTVSDDEGHTANAGQDVGGKIAKPEKQSTGVTAEKTSWKVTIHVPATGLKEIYLEDVVQQVDQNDNDWSRYGWIDPDSIMVSRTDKKAAPKHTYESAVDGRKTTGYIFFGDKVTGNNIEGDKSLSELPTEDYSYDVEITYDTINKYHDNNGNEVSMTPNSTVKNKIQWDEAITTIPGELQVYKQRLNGYYKAGSWITEKNNELIYCIRIDTKRSGLGDGNVTITDECSSKFRYVSGSAAVLKSTSDNSFWGTDAATHEIAWVPGAVTEPIESMAGGADTKKLTFRLTGLTGNAPDNRPYVYYLYYHLTVDDDVITSSDGVVLSNTATVTNGDQTATTNRVDYKYSNPLMTKELYPAPSQSNGYKGTYQITVPSKSEYFQDGKLIIVDTYSSTLSIEYASVEVYTSSNQKLGTDAYKVIPSGNNTMQIQILNPVDKETYKIKYTAFVKGTPGTKIDYVNKAYILGHEDKYAKKEESLTKSQRTDGGASVTTFSFYIYKYGSEDASIGLKGAEFALYRDTKLLLSNIVTGENGRTDKIVLDRNVNGEVLQKYTKYTLVETKAPEGHKATKKSIDFYFSDNTKKENEIEELGLKNAIELTAGDTLEVENEIGTPDVGSIQVTKAFSGLSELPKEFKITNDYNNTVFTVDNAVSTDPYTWKIDNVPVGTPVTFTESGYEAEGYNLTINGKASAEADKTVTATAEEGNTASVGFVNAYSRKVGSVQVTKAFSGLENLPEGFQITNSFNDTVFTVGNKTSGTGKANDPYTWVIENVPVGTEVTFTESGYDVTGYDVTINGQATTDAETGTVKATIAENETAIAKFTNEYTPTKRDIEISKVDLTDNKELEGASLQITGTDIDGKEITPIKWTSGDDGKNEDGTVKTHTVKLTAGTYTLSETAAPDGYKIAESIKFTIDKEGKVTSDTKDAVTGNKVTMKDEKKDTSASISVTKNLKTVAGENIYAVDQTFYVALYEDENCTKLASEIKALTFKNSTSETVTFEGVEPNKTYYVGECTKDGVRYLSGVVAGTKYVAQFTDGNSVTVETPNGSKAVYFDNRFMKFPDGFYKEGVLSITKLFKDKAGKAKNSDETFYAGIFDDEECTKLSENVAQNIIPLNLNGSSSVTAQIKVSIAQGTSKTFYVTEVDKDGKPINEETFKYDVSVENGEVTFDENNTSAEVTITNQEQDEDKDKDKDKDKGKTTTTSSNATSTKAVKTGDNTPIGIFVILLIAAIVVIGGGIYLKRRKK